MKQILNKDFIYEVLSVVDEIPEGYVATYGQIARLIGRDKNARLVGKVLGMAQYYGEYPCHRVVNHAGRYSCVGNSDIPWITAFGYFIATAIPIGRLYRTLLGNSDKLPTPTKSAPSFNRIFFNSSVKKYYCCFILVL